MTKTPFELTIQEVSKLCYILDEVKKAKLEPIISNTLYEPLNVIMPAIDQKQFRRAAQYLDRAFPWHETDHLDFLEDIQERMWRADNQEKPSSGIIPTGRVLARTKDEEIVVLKARVQTMKAIVARLDKQISATLNVTDLEQMNDILVQENSDLSLALDNSVKTNLDVVRNYARKEDNACNKHNQKIKLARSRHHEIILQKDKRIRDLTTALEKNEQTYESNEELMAKKHNVKLSTVQAHLQEIIQQKDQQITDERLQISLLREDIQDLESPQNQEIDDLKVLLQQKVDRIKDLVEQNDELADALSAHAFQLAQTLRSKHT